MTTSKTRPSGHGRVLLVVMVGLSQGLPRGRLDLAGSLGVSIVLKRCDAEDIS